MTTIWHATASGLVLITAMASAQNAGAAPEQRVHQDGKYRVFYYLEGEHAVETADLNGNHVPDQVEDAITQIKAAHILFVDVLGFPDPFDTPRYRGISDLNVSFRHKDTVKGNGKAFDEVSIRKGDPAGNRSLNVSVATTVKPSTNVTPAHEFFHVLQNSITYFKNRWYAEGTARWAERAFGRADARAARELGTWPMPAEKSEVLFGMAYEAAPYFWKPLVARFDPDEVIPASEKTERLKAMTYSDGTKVVKDLRLPGWRLIRDVLAELDRADDIAFRDLGYEKWSEENQRSPQNDAFILGAIASAVKKRDVGAASFAK